MHMQQRLNGYGSTANYIKRIVKHAVGIFLFSLLMYVIGKGLDYLLVDDTNSYTRIMMHEFYNQDNIDILFLGSSHCYRSFDTSITDVEFGANTFNAGSSRQHLDASYALLVEANREYELSEVYVELYYFMLQDDTHETRTEMTSTYIISDYMKPSINRIRFILQAGGKEHWVNGFVQAKRNGNKIFVPGYVSDLVKRKHNDSYKCYEYVDSSDGYYSGKGFVASTQELSVEDTDFTSDITPIAANAISEDSKKSIIDIISYCQRENISLTFVSAPMPDAMLVNVGDYDVYIRQVREFLAPYRIDYYDFNLCKEGYYSGQNDFYKDKDHLNLKGAQAFSKVFSSFFTGRLDEEELFYHSYSEKIGHGASFVDEKAWE